jgi:uridylate kinase
MKKLFVLSLGGSRINPGKVDTEFLKKFQKLILSQTKKGHHFIIITGGGSISRQYQDALKSIAKTDSDLQDWIGIYATRLNARLIGLMFGKSAHREIVKDPNIKIKYKEPILVSSGWKPGRSTDDVSVRIANTYGSDCVINLFDQDYVFDKDPRKFSDAIKIERISWKEFRKIVGNKWDPGAHAPFDPTAAKTAEKSKITVIIANGTNLKNLENIINDKPFLGTVIS